MQKINPTTIRNIFQGSTFPGLHNMLNLWAIEDEAVIGLDLQMSNLYELTLPDLMLVSEQELKDFFSQIKIFLHSLPTNITLQFVISTMNGAEDKINQYKKITHPQNDITKLILNQKVKHLQSVFTQTKKYYLFITTHPEEKNLSSLKTSFLNMTNKNYKPVTEKLHKKYIKNLTDISQNLTSFLSNIGVFSRKLPEQETLNMFYQQLNPSRSDFLKASKIDPEKTLRSQICFNACENEFDYLYIDGFYYRTINLHTRPEEINFAMLRKIIFGLTPTCDMVITLHTHNQETLLKKIQLKSSMARNINNLHVFKRNYEAENQAEEAEELVEKTKTTFQKLYEYSFCLILKERTLEELTTKTNYALQSFRNFGEAEAIIDDMNHLPLFLSFFPGHSHLNLRKHIFSTDAIAQMIPVSAEWGGCKEPHILFQTEDDQLLPIDLFDSSLAAKHGLILGQTGSGKSFTTNFILTNFYIESEKNHIVIIDVGGSYRKLCSFFGGEYLEIELSEKFAFNPFPSREIAIIKSTEKEFEVDSDVISFLTNLTQKMLKIKEFSGKEQKIMENAITDTYKHSKTNPPLLSSLHCQLMNYKGDEEDKSVAREYGKNLEIWTTGRYGKLLNRQSSLKPSSRLVVFDLQKLSEQPDLQAIVFFLVSSVIETKLKDLSLKKIIVIDEGWKFFSDAVGSLLIQNLYRTARKFNAGILSISQSPVDFLTTKAANAIISNSFIKYILRIKSGFDLLSQFGLNEQEIEEIRNLRSVKGEYSEILLKFAEQSRVIKIQPSPIDYWICTTDPDDTQIEKNFRTSHPKYTETQILEELAKLREEE